MMGSDWNWPSCGEIDIVERVHFNVAGGGLEGILHARIAQQSVHSHYVDDLKKKTPTPSVTHSSGIDYNQFNTYGVELGPNNVIFSLNGKETLNYPRTNDPADQLQFSFDKEWYLMIDMQLGGGWAGNPNNSNLPAKMEIDWVRYYKWQ
jgi:beta-glucanase (GH16 family)